MSELQQLRKIAQTAMGVQDACNLTAVANGFARELMQLRGCLKELGLPDDTDAIRAHPVVRLWAYKIALLAGVIPQGHDYASTFAVDYNACDQLSRGTV